MQILAKELWNNLKENFSQANGILIYEVMDSICALKQGDKSTTAYYFNLKNPLDELQVFEPPFNCSCDIKHLYFERQGGHRTIKFLNGLNSSFEGVRIKI